MQSSPVAKLTKKAKQEANRNALFDKMIEAHEKAWSDMRIYNSIAGPIVPQDMKRRAMQEVYLAFKAGLKELL